MTDPDWLHIRDNAMLNAVLLIWELPRMATAAGSRPDHKMVTRGSSYVDMGLKQSINVAIVGPRNSHTWDMNDVYKLVSSPTLHVYAFLVCLV